MLELKDALGWNQTPRDLERCLELAPEGCFQARLDGDLTGTAVVFTFGPVAWIAMVMVREELRGRGIGRALMERCLDHCRRRGLSDVRLDATDQGLGLYRACGFEDGWKISLARGQTGGPGSRAVPGEEPVRPIETGDVEEIVALDREMTGLERGAFLRALLADYPRFGLRLSRGGGAVLFRPGRHSWTIGPLWAAGREEAAALLRAALQAVGREGGSRSVLMSVPASSAAADELAQWPGFELTPRLTRMRLGSPPPAAPARPYVLSGPEKG